jgi:hypothetical protein
VNKPKLSLSLKSEIADALLLLCKRMRRDAGDLVADLVGEAVKPILLERAMSQAESQRQQEVTVHRLAILMAWRSEIKLRGGDGIDVVSSRFVNSLRKRGTMISERTLQLWDKKARAGEPLTDGRLGRRVRKSACPFMAKVASLTERHRTIAGAWRAACAWADKAGVAKRSYKVTQRYLRGIQRGVEETVTNALKGNREVPRRQSRAS